MNENVLIMSHIVRRQRVAVSKEFRKYGEWKNDKPKYLDTSMLARYNIFVTRIWYSIPRPFLQFRKIMNTNVNCFITKGHFTFYSLLECVKY